MRHARGWGAVAALVVAYDVWAIRRQEPTLSAAFRHASRHPVGRWIVIPGWFALTWHLVSGWPDR